MDKYLPLEESNSSTMEWVESHSKRTLDHFAGPDFDARRVTLDAILSASDHLVIATKRGDYAYNFHTDGAHPRGLWRRAPWEAYLAYVSPETEPEWEILLDVDALGRAEGKSWVFRGAQLLRPDYTRALITLSEGGQDASITREFDVPSRAFVNPSDAFVKPESKGSMQWYDAETVVVSANFESVDATDNGPYLTESGYPIMTRLWYRGMTLSAAREIIRGETTDVLAGAYYDSTPGYERLVAYRIPDFRTSIVYLVDPWTLEKTELALPRTAEVSLWHEWALADLRYEWEVAGSTFPAGSLVAVPLEQALSGDITDVDALFTPTPTTSLAGVSALHTGLVITTLDNVANKLHLATPTASGWDVQELETDLGEYLSISVGAVEPDVSDDVWVTTTGFTTPTTLFHGSVEGGKLSVRKPRSAPARFDADGLEVRQRWATSDDGTEIPYFVIGQPDALDGAVSSRTLLDGYGGFEVSRLPGYVGTYGKVWLERGGVYAVANIRGGGEFGPAWHQAALREGRHLAYEDFAAVARDLVATGVTTVSQLAAIGGSNGGMLMGNMYTTYPELFGAIVCRVPLLDMKRFSHLLAGASWMDEYGNPDTDDWEYLKTYSPYHNVSDGPHPPILLTTSTRDDRVHPGHARKFMALLEEKGLDAFYYENTEGGHAGAADPVQQALMLALIFTFLDEKLA